MTAPPTLLEVAAVTPFGHTQTRAERDLAKQKRWVKSARFYDLGTIATYFPAVYAPAAVVMTVSRAVHASPVETFRAGRWVNVLTFPLLGAAALAVARRGRALIAAVLLLPMSLGLAASLSGDGVLIAVAALAAACVTRGDGRGWWVAAGLVTLIGLTKLPYAPLLLVPLVTVRPRLPVRLGAVTVPVVVALASYLH